MQTLNQLMISNAKDLTENLDAWGYLGLSPITDPLKTAKQLGTDANLCVSSGLLLSSVLVLIMLQRWYPAFVLNYQNVYLGVGAYSHVQCSCGGLLVVAKGISKCDSPQNATPLSSKTTIEAVFCFLHRTVSFFVRRRYAVRGITTSGLRVL